MSPIRVVTCEIAPFHYIEEGKNTGFSTEIVLQLLRELKIEVPIETLPWPRAYQTALKQKNTLIYTLARTQDREHLFHWIGVLGTGESYLFSLRNRDIRLNSLSDAIPYRIGVIRNDTRARFLREKGIPELDLVADGRMNAVKLIKGRIDLWAEGELIAVHLIRELGHDPERILKRVLYLHLNPKPAGYLAFGKDTDSRLIADFKRAYTSFTLTPAYQTIKDKYQYTDPVTD